VDLAGDGYLIAEFDYSYSIYDSLDLGIGTSLTIGAGITIDGQVGYIGSDGSGNTDASTAIVFQGAVDADGADITINPASWTNVGTLQATNRGVLTLDGSDDTNSGTLEATGGSTLTVSDTALENSGVLAAYGDSALNLDFGALTIDSPGTLIVQPSATITIAGSLVGDTTDADLYQPQGTVNLDGSGTSTIPQFLEAMSDDLDNVSAGYEDNFAYGTLAIGPNDYVRLVDLSNNSGSSNPEAVYVNTLVVPSGSTLDLNGLNLYYRTASIQGTITAGSATPLEGGGPVELNTNTPGDLQLAGEVDSWTFFGRAGEAVDLFLYTGRDGNPSPIQPALDYGQVTLLDPDGNTVAVVSSNQSGADADILNQVLTLDGTYTVEIQAAPGQSSATGNYVLGAYDATSYTSAVELNQTINSQIESPYNQDQWTFSASANTQIQFNLIASQSSLIQFSLTGPDGFTGFTGQSTSSGLITLPDSGTYTLIVTTSGAEAGAYAFQLLQTTQMDLTIGTPYEGTLAGSGQAELFMVNLPNVEPLGATLQDLDSSDQNELYLKFGSPPTRSDYGYRYSNLAAADQQIVVPSAAPGSWYILLYGASIPSGSDYTLTASTGTQLLSVSPSEGGTSTDDVLTLTGTGFTAQTTVNLVAMDETAFPLSNVVEVSPTELMATIPAGSVPSGVFSVAIKQPDGTASSLSAAFSMIQGGQAKLVTDLVVPNPIGNATPTVLYVQYSNTGDIAMPAPLLVLSATNSQDQQGAIMTLNSALQFPGPEILRSSEPPGYSTSVQILASGATPGFLEPGESITVPVYYAGWITTVPDYHFFSPYTFTLGVLQAGNTSSIDWTSLKQSSQPPDVSSTAWSAIFANVEASTGSTWGDYVQYLDNEAQYLGTLGEDVTDLSDLYSFEIQQADGLSPITQLGASVDASMPTPGSLSLSFSRFFTPSITGRNVMGPLGMGWSDNWQTSLAVQSDGTVVVTEPGGVQRIFEPVLSFDSATGSYQAQPGDYGVLTATGNGTFTLTEQDGTVTAYNADGTLNYVEDTDGNTITAGYTNGLLTSLTASSGQSLTIAYNAAGLIASVTDSAGRETTYRYDPTVNYLTSVTTSDGQTTSYTYDTSINIETENALLSITYPDGTHSYFTYDSEGRIASTSADGGAEMTTYAYGPGGAVASTDALGNTTTDYFDDNGLILKVTDPLGNSTGYTYDSNFNLTQITDPAGQITSNQYDSQGNLISTTDPLGQTTNFTYTNTDDNLASVADANGNTTQYAYDGNGDLTSTTYADGTIASVAYNPIGEAISSTDQDGQVMAYTYNAAGQVLTEIYTDGTVDSFTYDAYGDLTSMTDSTGATTFTYNADEELINVTYPTGLYLNYTYDSAGRRIQMVDQDGFTVNYSYDAVGNLSELTDANGNLIVNYTYDAAGNLIRQDDGNGTYTTYTYDANGDVLSLINYAPDGSINSSFIYTYNDLGLETSETTLDGTWTYTYDAIGELTHAVFASTNPDVPDQDETYNYDAVGNRTSTVINGVTTLYTTNDVNEYTQVGGTTYTYDANGNMISATDASGTTTYTYHQNNQLVGVTTPDGDDSTYIYDAIGYQVSSIQGGQQVNNLIDPSGLGNVVGQFDASNNVIADYTYGIGLVSQSSSSGAVSYYNFDDAGSTVGLTDSDGTYVNSYGYLPFGQLLTASVSVVNPFEYVGQWGVSDEGNGLDFMRARDYSPATGVFTSQDALGIDQTTLYSYVNNNPINNIDPVGLYPINVTFEYFYSGRYFGVARRLVIIEKVALDRQTGTSSDHAAVRR
jgi:RHS repeat-associated protein